MNVWKHILVDWEYPDRKRIVSDLGLDSISQLPTGAKHSIYEELWHITRWQEIVISRNQTRRKAWIEGDRYPSTPAPSDKTELEALVGDFLQGLNAAAKLTFDDAMLNEEAGDGLTIRDELVSLAVHNAYHLGKIVAMRQQLGCWPESK